MQEQGSEAWLLARENLVATASVLGEALGVGYGSVQKFLERKWAKTREEPTWIMLEGQKREPYVRHLFLSLLPYFTCELPTLAVLPEDPRFGGSPDGILTHVETGERYLLEVKTRPNQPEMREEIPVTHLLQMLLLCRCYDLVGAYYICSTYDVGLQVAKVTFKPELWPEVYRRMRLLAIMYEKHVKPKKQAAGDRDRFSAFIREYCLITAIPELESKTLPGE